MSSKPWLTIEQDFEQEIHIWRKAWQEAPEQSKQEAIAKPDCACYRPKLDAVSTPIQTNSGSIAENVYERFKNTQTSLQSAHDFGRELLESSQGCWPDLVNVPLGNVPDTQALAAAAQSSK